AAGRFAELSVARARGPPRFDVMPCQRRRNGGCAADEAQATVQWLFPLGIPNPPRVLPFCDTTPGIDCHAATISVWQEIQAAAEEAYDRTSACRFTTFVGYEHTNSPLGPHPHPNTTFPPPPPP